MILNVISANELANIGGKEGHTSNCACRNRLFVDPEGDLRQHNHHYERDVSLYEVVAQLPLEVEMDHLHRVVTCKINSTCEESNPRGTERGSTEPMPLPALETE